VTVAATDRPVVTDENSDEQARSPLSTQPAIQLSSRLGRPLGTGRDWRRRLLLHHVPLALASAAHLDMGASSPFPTTAEYGMQGGGGRTFESAFTIATGYVATALLGLTLLIGPANLLLRRRTPVSTSLARDTGTWAAIVSLVHVIVGLKAHGRRR
jgi:hypothetical protein